MTTFIGALLFLLFVSAMLLAVVKMEHLATAAQWLALAARRSSQVLFAAAVAIRAAHDTFHSELREQWEIW